MKAKKTLTAVAIILAILVISSAALILSGNQITVARCIVNDNGCLYMVYNDRPVSLSGADKTGLQTGDRLLILHQSAFAESLPEQTKTYFVIKIGNGSIDDIPQKAIDILIQTKNWNE